MLKRSRLVGLVSTLTLAGAVVISLATPGTAASPYKEYKPDCRDALPLCAEVANPQEAFGNYYIGHDEPATIFYSNTPGSGNNVRYSLTIPTEPAGAYSNTNGYDFELRPAFWFGMAMCDTQSFPEQIHTCTPDSDTNIVDPSQTKKGPGVAFMELQFYPPGFVRQFAGFSCDATKWCAALTIDSLSEDPMNGTVLNASCQNQILGGIEYINFAFLTLDGTPLGAPNPLQFDPSEGGNPQNADTFFLNQGDRATVTLHDTAHGLSARVDDLTTGLSGSMVASAANGFGQIRYVPGTSKTCQELPYDFHPMYSTSSPQTRVLWAAHSYNIAFSDEIGHFDFCSSIDPNSPTASCNGQEGIPGDQEQADGDDNFCFSAAHSLLYPANGCLDTNSPGFDGTSYQNYWPDGSATKPTSVLFSSPKTGSDYSTSYPQYAFETDLPRIEAADLGGKCNRTTGAHCVNPPPTDDNAPATFYPYFSTVSTTSGCAWGIGSTLPNTIDNFGGSSAAEYGPLYQLTYWAFGGHGATLQRFNDFNTGPQTNNC